MFDNDSASESGSVLIEALAALVVLSTAVILSLNGFADATARLKEVEERLAALSEAHNLLVENIGRATLVAGENRGFSEAGFAWTVKVSEETSGKASFLARPYRISVSVEKELGKAPAVVLETIVTAHPGAK